LSNLNKLIDIQLNQKQDKILISVNNLKMNFFAEYGQEVSENDIKEKLIIDNRLIQINKRQFVIKKQVYNFISEKNVIELLHSKNYKYLLYKFKKVIECNFPVFQVDEEIVIESLKEKVIDQDKKMKQSIDKDFKNFQRKNNLDKNLLSKIVVIFEEYHRNNEQAVRINEHLFKKQYFENIDCSMNDLIETLESSLLFYKLTKKSFALKKWIILELVKKVSFDNKIIKLHDIETVVSNILNVENVNKKNLLNLFNENNKFKVLGKTNKSIQLICDFKSLKLDLKHLYQKHINLHTLNLIFDDEDNQNRTKFKKLLDTLEEPKLVSKLKEEFGLDISNGILVYSSLSYKNIYYNNGYLMKKSKPELADTLQKAGMIYKYANNKLNGCNLQELIKNLFKKVNKPMTSIEIQRYLSILNKRINPNQIEKILEQCNYFKCINYKTWINNKSVKWGKYKEFCGNFKQELNKILKDFDKRKEYILFNRTFKSDQATLSEIGNELGLSRERIRQLENQAIRQIIHPQRCSNYRRYFKLLEKVFTETRVIKVDDFWNHSLIKDCFTDVDLELLINFYNDYNANQEYKKIQLLYDEYLVYMKPQYYKLLWKRVRNELTNEENMAKFKDVVQFFSKFMIKNEEFLKETIFKKSNIIKIEDKLLIKEKKVYETDKIKLILSLIGKPVHYKQVTGLYNQYFTETTAHNIHSKLNSYDEDFIRVDSGTYGLTSWDCEEDIYVRDLNYQILKEEKNPLHYEEVAKRVLECKEVEKKTVYAFLHDNKRIFNYSRGLFALKEWKDDEKIAGKYNINSWRIKASEQGRVYDYFLGSFNGRKGRLVSLHKISKKYYYEDCLKLSKKVIKRMEIKNQISGIDIEGRIYNLYFDQKQRVFKGIKNFFKENDIKIGDYIYIEYYSSELVKFHKKNEYEKNYKPILETDFRQSQELNSNKVIDQVLNASKTDIKDEGRIEIVNLESAIEYGLRYGQVKFNELMKLDYKQEKINDHFEAIQLLDNKNIEIVYD
jgi:hypothetical protein